MTSSDLPDDVIENILLRVANVKDLGAWKSVNKMWNSMISDESFVKNHIKRQKGSKILFYHSPFQVNNLVVLSPSSFLELSRHACHDDNKKVRTPSSIQYSSACDGLICLSNKTLGGFDGGFLHNVWLWNPSTTQLTQLPHPLIRASEEYYEMGFGFDAETKDYKIVRIAGDFLGGQESTNMHPQLSFTAEVYTMSTNYWHITGETFTARLGRSEVFPEPCPGYSPQVIMFGASFNWLTDRKIRDHARADKVGDASHTIISFDIAKEVFDFMRAPRGLMKYVRLGKCLDCLSILSHNVSSVMEIWVMRDYGVSESWTRQYHVDMNRPSIQLWGEWIPLMFGENPKEVVVGCNSGYGPFILFNHETGEERDLSDEFPENIVGQVQLIHNHIPQSLLPTYNVKTLQEKQFNECLQILQNLKQLEESFESWSAWRK